MTESKSRSDDMEDQRMGRAIKTRHLEALRDLQKSESDRLQRIKNDPSRQLSRHHSVEPDDLGDYYIKFFIRFYDVLYLRNFSK